MEIVPPAEGARPLAQSKLLLEELTGPITDAGGSMQFVADFVAKCGEKAVGERLTSFYGQEPDISYASKESLQMDDDREHIYQLSDMGFGPQSSTKGPPRLHVCVSLCDSIFADGFVTHSDPLMVWKNPQTMQCDSFWPEDGCRGT